MQIHRAKERPFHASYNDEAHTLAISGSVDELAVEGLRRVLLAAAQTAPERELVIDLNDVDFLPSIALGVLVGVRRRGYSVRFAADEGTIAFRVLRITGLVGVQDQEVI